MAVHIFTARSARKKVSSLVSIQMHLLPSILLALPLIITIIRLTSLTEVSALSPFIRKYEALTYDTAELHQRVRRALFPTATTIASEEQQKPVAFQIPVNGRNLRLKLFPDTSTFTDDHALFDGKNVQQEFPQHLPFLYEGYVIGSKNSYVHGAIRDGVFDGKIYLSPDEVYIVEPSRRYVKNANFHSIIYAERDVIHPEHHQHSPSEINSTKSSSTTTSAQDADLPPPSTCGLSSKVQSWMEKVQNSALAESDAADWIAKFNMCDSTATRIDAAACRKTMTNSTTVSLKDAEYSPMPSISSIYSLASRQFLEENYERLLQKVVADNHTPSKAARHKRSVLAQSQMDRKRVCRMYIQTDSFLWRHIIETERTAARARDEILSMIASHVKAISAIYQSYDFGGIRGIKFAVQRTTINDTDYCVENRVEDPFCKRHVDVSNLLSYNSLANHSDFCLAYLFTYRDFVGGTLGLAWVASPNGPSGGICEKYKLFSETRDGVRIRGWKSLNTGVITFVNYGSRVPPTVSHLTLAHEVGHNFGAPHDPAACQPNGPLGNFIMYPSATSGDKPNNRKFSECSLEKMTAVVQAVVNEFNGKRNCFAATDEAFCGNKITEEGEVCDCGYNSQECKEKCCYPAVMQDADYREQGQACTLRRKPNGMTVSCSPSQGPCCTENCTYFGLPIQCKQETECAQAASCTGNSPHCPRAVPKPDLSLCAQSTRVCLHGECSGTLCLLLGMEECFLTHERLPAGVVGQEMMCFVACQEPGKPHTCRSTYNDELEFPKHLLPPHQQHGTNTNDKDDNDNDNSTISGIRLKPGSPCNNYRGYCDIFHRCRRVDSEGALERITKFVFDERTLRGMTQWARENWWEVALVLLATLLFSACFIKCLAVHTPSNNPKLKRHRTLHDDWETLSTTIRRGRSHHHGGDGHGQHGGHGHRRRGRDDRGASDSAAAAVAAAVAAAGGGAAAAASAPLASANNNVDAEQQRSGNNNNNQRQRSRQRRSRSNNNRRGGGAAAVAADSNNNNNNRDAENGNNNNRRSSGGRAAQQQNGNSRDDAGRNNNNDRRVRGRRDDRRSSNNNDRTNNNAGATASGAGDQQRRSSSSSTTNHTSSSTVVNIVPGVTITTSTANPAVITVRHNVGATSNTNNSERAPLFMPNSVSSATTVQQIIPDSPPPTYHEAMQRQTAAATTATAATAASSATPPVIVATSAERETVPFLFPFVKASDPPLLPARPDVPGVHAAAPPSSSLSMTSSSGAASSSTIQQRPLPPLPSEQQASSSRNAAALPGGSSPAAAKIPLLNIDASALQNLGVQLPPAGHRKNRRGAAAAAAAQPENSERQRKRK